MRVVQMNPFTSSSKSYQPEGRQNQNSSAHSSNEPSLLPFNIKNFKKDDWILLGIISALVLEGSDDYILLCALGYLFLAGL